MSKRLAVTKNGTHKIGKKLFYTGKNLIHRKAKKAFLTENGVHRLVFSSGVGWSKYSCDVEVYTDNIYAEVTPSGEMKTFTVWYVDAFYAYEFEAESGFGGGWYNGIYNNNEHINTVEKANSTDLIGMYRINDTQVWEIVSVDEVKNGGTHPLSLKFTAKLVAQCEVSGTEEYENYSQGSISYGTVEADEGALPESGRLVEGSVEEGYCVLKINGAYYYYLLNKAEDDDEYDDSAELDTAIIGYMKLG